MTYLIVGSGISGASLSNLISKNEQVTVIDSSDHIAGNCYDYKKYNIMIQD